MKRLMLPLALLLGLTACGGEDYGLDQHGNKVTGLDGQWKVVNYWAEWCGPCRKEVPELNALAKEGVKVVGVNYDQLQGEALARSAQTLGIEFTVLATDPAVRWQLKPAEVLPVTWIVDPKGQPRAQLAGEQTGASIRAKLAELQ